jgi:toxin HigB-1
MIATFGDRDTEFIFRGRHVRRFHVDVQAIARRKMRALNRAKDLRDLSGPGYGLHRLDGDRAGQWAIRVNDQYRICFAWRDANAYDVELTDYH